LQRAGFPEGLVYLEELRERRLLLARDLREECDFVAGIADRWDDNELHSEIGCLSVILLEHAGDWKTVPQRIVKYHRERKIKENEIHLRGKIEGLARVLPLLLPKYGEEMWTTFHEAVLEMAEASREDRKREDLESFAEHGLNPADLRHAAEWDELTREEDWESNAVFGLQDSETVEATERRYVHKVTRCLYAELWEEHGRPDVGYQIHCRTDMAWWDRPAWNAKVRFEQPKTLMQGDDCCLFIQRLPDDEVR
jgi:hypothetical protein